MSGAGEPLLVGISGVSSSGKTTLARHLRDIWPNTFILHEDDFYWPDSQIPVKNGVQDWDCLESLDLVKLKSCLEYIKANGKAPPDLVSMEDQNSVGESIVDQAVVQRWREEAQRISSTVVSRPIAVIDGFLMYSKAMSQIWSLLDVRLFLHTSYDTAKRRREARQGYVTIDGFWEDPPGYVDDVVWPNFVKEHAFLFRGHDVGGEIDEDVCNEMRLNVMPKEAENDMTKCVEWACGNISARLTSDA